MPPKSREGGRLTVADIVILRAVDRRLAVFGGNDYQGRSVQSLRLQFLNHAPE